MLKGNAERKSLSQPTDDQHQISGKRSFNQMSSGKGNEDDSDEEPTDEIRLWEDGWKERYYQGKFEVSAHDSQFRHKVAAAYVEGTFYAFL